MAGRKLDPTDIPTPGPWLVMDKAEPDALDETAMLGVWPATTARPGGKPYLIRQALPMASGGMPLAIGIERLADARLMAAAPDLADILLQLLTAPELNRHDIDPRTRQVRDAAWDLLVRVTPHLEIGAGS